jgi:NhaP-type Na+/H+ or K+/H+ antiporter
VLFVEGLQLDLAAARSNWRLPARALGLGLPITLLATALLARLVLDFSWIDALIVGAILAPTDPVFASALVHRESVPVRLRRMLRLESGLNDGLALPIVLVLLALARHEQPDYGALALEVAGGILIGVVVPWLFVQLHRVPVFRATNQYRPLGTISVALVLAAVGALTNANVFLAAFVGGLTLGALREEPAREFESTGELISELVKLAAVLVFGGVLTPALFAQGLDVWLFALAALLVARPAALSVALAGRALSWGEWGSAAWFGPKGFASVVFALIALHAGIPSGNEIFTATALVIALSMVLHSSTDALVAQRFAKQRGDEAPAAG